jgi:hypothetical protein
MNTLIVYDDTGYVLYYISGYYRVPQGGIQFMEVNDMPQNQYVLSVDVSATPHVPIYGIPTSDTML